jgi:hypothetical protein
MKKLLFLFTLISYLGFSQTTLLSPTGAGGFELGTTLTANGWTAVNGTRTTRIWQCGTGQAGYTGARAAFIGNSSTNVGTTTAARTVHIYRSITIPAGATNISLTFKYKQAVADNTYDYLRVTLLSTIPVSGTLPTSDIITTIDPTVGITTYTTQNVTIPNSYAGTTRNLVFTWKSDNATPHAYGGLDDIGITYTPGSNCSGTPNAGTVSTSVNNTCSSTATTLTGNGLTSATGITYQWQSSSDNSIWTDVSGQVSTTYLTTLPLGSMYYRIRTTCTSSGISSNSSSIQLIGTSCVTIPSNSTTLTNTGCSGTLYDPGNTSNYGNNQTGTVTLYPSNPTDKVRLTFTSFSTESGYDGLVIYNGNNTSASIISSGLAAGSNTTNCPAGSYYGLNSPGTITSTATDGSLTLVFRSDISSVSTGFEAGISCVVLPAPGCASLPTSPSDLSTNITLTPTLTWPTVEFAQNYDVYFGTTLPSTPNINTTSTSYVPGTLLPTTTYFWKIVPKNSVGEATGCSTWSFTTLTPPSNDDPSGAIELTVTVTENLLPYTNQYSSATTTESSPSCASYAGEDVWFKVIVPFGISALDFNTQIGNITDGGMSIYRGTIGSLVEIECNDDDSPNGLMPFISRTDFTEFETIYIRVWEYGGGTVGTFSITVTTPQALPVELLYFEGTQYSTFNMLKWATASEQNSSHFIVENSIDGENWKEIGIKTAAGNSTENIYYSFSDDINYLGLNYYRLVQYDIDGKFEIYGPIALNNEIKEKKIIKYVNLMGQEISPETSGVVFEVYEDGTSKKIIR